MHPTRPSLSAQALSGARAHAVSHAVAAVAPAVWWAQDAVSQALCLAVSQALAAVSWPSAVRRNDRIVACLTTQQHCLMP